MSGRWRGGCVGEGEVEVGCVGEWEVEGGLCR